MKRAMIVIHGNRDRERAATWCVKAPPGCRIEFKASKRTLPQNDKMWSMLTEISSQLDWHGDRLTPDEWKILFLDALDRDEKIVRSIDGAGFVSLGRSSSDLSKAEMSDMIELMFSFGALHGVEFQDDRDKAA